MQASCADARAPLAPDARKLCLDGFEQCRDAHAAGDAERRDAEPGAGVFTARHAREEARDQNRARRRKRMSARNRAAVRVQQFLVDLEGCE